MCNQKYTRKQIREAIEYWTSKLNLMTESINNTIDALYALKAVLKETDDQTHINSTEHSVIMRTRGSHSYFFAEFD